MPIKPFADPLLDWADFADLGVWNGTKPPPRCYYFDKETGSYSINMADSDRLLDVYFREKGKDGRFVYTQFSREESALIDVLPYPIS